MKFLPLIPIHESTDGTLSDFINETTGNIWYGICSEEDAESILSGDCIAEDFIISDDIESIAAIRDSHFPGHSIVGIENITPNQITGVEDTFWMESCRYWGVAYLNGEIRSATIIEETDTIHEGKRATAASNSRLKRIIQDTLNRSKVFKGSVNNVKISNNKLTISLDQKTYLFEIERNEDGWVTKIKFLAPKGSSKEIKSLQAAITNAFKSTSFQQIIEDAASKEPPTLIMLDYTRLDGGRRTRLSEPYSYRFNPEKNRWYYYGWNVEEGGIRSYILERIKGARLTDIPFRPRFFVEVGRSPNQGDRSMNISGELNPVVTKPVIKRAHTKFDLKGGYGKIVKRLGHSVPTPMKQSQDKREKKAKKKMAQKVQAIKKRAKQSVRSRRRI